MGLVDQLLHFLSPLSDDPLERRDPVFIAELLSQLGPLTDAWFAPELTGLEHVPDGAALIVGTHNGGAMAPDMFCTMVGFWRHFGVERPSYGLAHDQVFRVPLLARWLGRCGAVPAHQRHALALLQRGASVLVYPGGDLDAFKPFAERHLVKFGERSGFVRTALRASVPIVPVISVGAHDTIRVLTDGRALAHRLGLKKYARIEVLPIMLCLPFGLSVGPWESHLPAPSKLRIRVLPAIHLPHPPEAADDAAVVDACKDEVRATMQSALDALVAEGGFGVRERFTELL